MDHEPVATVGNGSVGDVPVIRHGSFSVKSVGETFLDMRSWGKGVIWINGHNLGRYWNIGPQQTLYVPGCWLNPGENSVTVFEMLNSGTNELQGLDIPILNQLREATVAMNVRFDSLKTEWRASLQTDDSTDAIYYTADGGEPTSASLLYSHELVFKSSASIRARARRGDFISAGITRRDIVASFATGKPVAYKIPFTPKYSGGGMMGLTNGLAGSLNFRDGQWQGFQGSDCDVTVDLGEVREISSVSVNFLQDAGSWIFLPKHVEIEISDDGKSFTSLLDSPQNEPANRQGAFTSSYASSAGRKLHGRYVRIFGQNIGVCPDWHPGKGGKSWIFADEIVVR